MSEDTHNYDRPAVDSHITREGTLSAMTTIPSTGDFDQDHVVVIGGAIDRDTLSAASLFAASGPTTKARQAPDISAISDETRTHRGRMAAGTFSGSVSIISGTSVACPVVTRALVDDLSKLPEGRDNDRADFALLGKATVPLEPGPGRRDRRMRPD